MSAHTVESAQVVLPCGEPISATIEFFTGIGFKVRTIVPADHPRMAVLEGHGLTVRLEVGTEAPPAHLRLLVSAGEPGTVTAPNGTIIEFATANPPLQVPPLVEEFVVTRMPTGDGADDSFGEGRAGMRYRDLIPSRLGGRFIASHILIPQGGPVGDYVHFHNIRFQMIYCYRGWVKVAYEDQGEPMLLQEGDCFLQPSTIRHRVLEASDRMQVIEIGCRPNTRPGATRPPLCPPACRCRIAGTVPTATASCSTRRLPPRGCRGAWPATSTATPASARRWMAWPGCGWCVRWVRPRR